MKKLFPKLRDKVRTAVATVKNTLTGALVMVMHSRKVLANNRAEGYIDTASASVRA